MNKIELQFTLRRDICEEDLPEVDPIDEINNNEINPINYNLFVYAMNYNIFRIMGGIAGLAFEI